MDIQRDERRMEHVESLRGVLQDILTVDLMPDETDFLEIYGRVCSFVNSSFSSHLHRNILSVRIDRFNLNRIVSYSFVDGSKCI